VVLLENVMCDALFAVRLFDGVSVLAAGPASGDAGAKLHAETEVSRRSADRAGMLAGPDLRLAVLC
jgi:hypothetical protein